MTDVFISYKSPDRPTVREIAEMLKKVGITYWVDYEHIGSSPHSEYAAAINGAIRNCRAMIVVASKTLKKDPSNVVNEINIATNNKLKFFPIFIENTALPENIEYYISVANYYQAFNDFENVTKKMITDLAKYLGKSIDFRRLGTAPRKTYKAKYTSFGSFLLAMWKVSADSSVTVKRNAVICFIAAHIFSAIVLSSYFGFSGTVAALIIFILTTVMFVKKFKN